MSWQDIGLIFPVNDLFEWAHSHAYLPTPCVLSDRIRIFVAFLDSVQIGRIGYIDVSKENPTQIIGVSEKPVLDIGMPGSFDEHGVSPMTIIKVNDTLRLYYIGWQRSMSKKIRYTLYTGLAESDDQGRHFHRISQTPILGGILEKSSIQTIGAVLEYDSQFYAWYARSVAQVKVNDKFIPSYELRHLISKDGLEWIGEGQIVFPVKEKKILGYGRSAMWLENNQFRGLFSVRGWEKGYQTIFYSQSENGVDWAPLTPSFSAKDTVDQQAEVCFPGMIFQDNRTLMFYNGDQFGRAGLRLASAEKT